jgi:hypothetical protein
MVGGELGTDLANTLTQTVPDPPHMIMISAYGENDPRAGVSLALQAAGLGYRLRGALAWGQGTAGAGLANSSAAR